MMNENNFLKLDINSVIVGNTLVNYQKFNTNKPLMVTFSPAGEVLSSMQVKQGSNAWAYDYFVRKEINILAFSAIDIKHWFVCPELKKFIESLSSQLSIFPERLGYGASMGAFGLSLYFELLSLDRLLLITPIPAPKHINEPSSFNYAAEFNKPLTIIIDPFCPEDTRQAKKYPSQAIYLKFPGVGHQVIESLSQLKILTCTLNGFIENNLLQVTFAKQVRKRRLLIRYFSYMARNPTKKGSYKRKLFLSRLNILYSLKHPILFMSKLMKKWKKSISKKFT